MANNESSKQDNGDWLDNMCGGVTDAICPLPDQDVIAKVGTAEAEPKPEDKDVLDHVFTRVETLSCAADAGGGDDSSVVWPTSTTAPNDGQAPAPAAPAAENKGILLQEGDALDRMFERVESLVCSPEPDTTDDACSLVGEDHPVVMTISDDKGDGHPDVESGGTSTSLETQLEEETLKKNREELWYQAPKCQICLMALCLLTAVLCVNAVLFITRWQD
jgi:hypothetical protein